MDDVGWSWLVIIIFAGLSFFFSLHKLIFQMFSRVKLTDAYKDANRTSHTDRICDDQEKLLLICAFFWRIFSLCCFISLAVVLLKDQQSTLDFILLFIITTVFSICNFAVSYAWAKYAGEVILVRTYMTLKPIIFISSPVFSVFRLNDLLVKRLSGYSESTPEAEKEEKQEELLSVVEERMMEGVVDAEEHKMIEHVLELGETEVVQIMTPRTDVIALDVNSSLQRVLDTIENQGHSRIPVYEDNIDKIIGLVYAKDLLKEIGKNNSDFNLKNKLRPAYFVPETKLLSVLLNEFRTQKLHIAVVLDEYGGTAGLITIEDILEELVGEITDEYEQHEPENTQRIDEKTIEVDARMYIDDLNSELDIDLPEDEDYDTIGGFVFSHLGYIPKSGETFKYEDIEFTITKAEQRSVKRVRIKLPDKAEPNGV